jgi:hypothetical protein
VTSVRAVLDFLAPYVNPEGWQYVTFLNSWTDYGVSWNRAQFRKDPTGRVWVRGLVKRTTAGYTPPIFVLPVNYRPKKIHIFNTIGNNNYSRIDVGADGVVALSASASGSATPEAFVSLDGISFDTV